MSQKNRIAIETQTDEEVVKNFKENVEKLPPGQILVVKIRREFRNYQNFVGGKFETTAESIQLISETSHPEKK